MNKIMLDGIEVKVGAKMYSLAHGDVVVDSINTDEYYPIMVKSVNAHLFGSFTLGGEYYRDSSSDVEYPRVLFWNKPEINYTLPTKKYLVVMRYDPFGKFAISDQYYESGDDFNNRWNSSGYSFVSLIEESVKEF